MAIYTTEKPHGPSPRRSGTAVAATLILAALSWLLITPGPRAAAQVAPGTTLEQAFATAARHWGIPQQVLMAVGYVESHWDQRGGDPSLDKGYGIMHLVDGTGGTLERGAALTGLPVDAIRRDEVANIEAGSALLSDISRKLQAIPKGHEANLAGWYKVVATYSGATDLYVADQYAQEVYRVIQQGAAATLPTGEAVTLPPTRVQDVPAPAVPAPDSDDYGPALWVPASSSNYTVGRPYGPLSYIIIHDTEGSYASAVNWFQNPSSGVSAHYVIRSSDGQITQMVREANTAWHAGVWDYNVRSFGIEHEGYQNQQGWYTEAMYQASSALARHLADTYGIRKDRAHIIGHSQVPNQSHTDPGPYWDWNHYMSLVRRDWARAALVDNTDAGFAPVPTPVDPAHYWNTYGNGYGNSNTYQTLSVSNQSYSVNSGTWTTQLPTSGYYDVYAFVPWVDNATADTSSARYEVNTANGWTTSAVSQKAITDVGNGSWAHVGTFYFNAWDQAQVRLTDYTGESGRNVWFDAIMWIPTAGGSPPPTGTPAPATPRPPTATRTWTPQPTPTDTPTWTPTPAPTWTPGPCGMRFTDLPDTYWAYNYVSYLYCNGVISGYGDGTFRPGAPTTRAQIAKMITLAFGWSLWTPTYPDFSDVPTSDPYYSYIETCYVRGVISGYADGTFRPGSQVTRGQVTKMLVLAKGWIPSFPSNPDFADVPPDSWAYGYVEVAFQRGVITGYDDGTFRPGNGVNRSQFSKMLAITMQSALGPSKAGPKSTPTKAP